MENVMQMQEEGGRLRSMLQSGLASLIFLLLIVPPEAVNAAGGSFMTECPASTSLHPQIAPTQDNPTGANPGIKCQHVAGGDGYATMGDGSQMYLFGFGPLSGMDLINQGLPGTQTAGDFHKAYNSSTFPDGVTPDPLYDPALTTNRNGAVTEAGAIMNLGILSSQQPAPLMAIDEGDELFLTLSNVGQIMRPDLFEQHTIHFHGYPNASAYMDGVPDASVAIGIFGSMTYYYTAPEAGTYFWHCHITPPEHLQMGMVGQLYVRPRQNKLPDGSSLYNASLVNQCDANDILCGSPVPSGNNNATHAAGAMYAYNDGDGSTRYDVEYPIQMMGFDPNFHYISMTFNPGDFAGMQDKYWMLNGRSYPDTVTSNTTDINGTPVTMTTQSSDGLTRPSQPMPALITINKSQGQTRALLRISQLSVTEFVTLSALGVPMQVIGTDARMLRDQAGNNLYYNTNSITLAGGQTADVLLDVSNVNPGTYFLYSTNLDHLSNDAENFGGMMTEIRVE